MSLTRGTVYNSHPFQASFLLCFYHYSISSNTLFPDYLCTDLSTGHGPLVTLSIVLYNLLPLSAFPVYTLDRTKENPSILLSLIAANGFFPHRSDKITIFLCHSSSTPLFTYPLPVSSKIVYPVVPPWSISQLYLITKSKTDQSHTDFGLFYTEIITPVIFIAFCRTVFVTCSHHLNQGL